MHFGNGVGCVSVRMIVRSNRLNESNESNVIPRVPDPNWFGSITCYSDGRRGYNPCPIYIDDLTINDQSEWVSDLTLPLLSLGKNILINFDNFIRLNNIAKIQNR